jgi:hypothetical protein
MVGYRVLHPNPTMSIDNGAPGLRVRGVAVDQQEARPALTTLDQVDTLAIDVEISVSPPRDAREPWTRGSIGHLDRVAPRPATACGRG